MSKPAQQLTRGGDPRHVARINGLVNRLISMAEDDLTVLEIARRAPMALLPVRQGVVELTPPLLSMSDEDLLERGWTRGELQVALHALANKRECPVYMHFAHERTITRQKLLGASAETPSRARSVVIPVAPLGESK